MNKMFCIKRSTSNKPPPPPQYISPILCLHPRSSRKRSGICLIEKLFFSMPDRMQNPARCRILSRDWLRKKLMNFGMAHRRYIVCAYGHCISRRRGCDEQPDEKEAKRAGKKAGIYKFASLHTFNIPVPSWRTSGCKLARLSERDPLHDVPKVS